jgi:riboflavin kinase/FMN adenylyltransferase
MQLFCETSDIGSRPSVATIGFFDGVHRGHRYLIEQVRAVAAGRGLASSVVTFSVHPRKVMQADYHPKLLTTCDEKVSLLAKTGVDYCMMLDFTPEIARLSAREFMFILKERYQIQALVVGYDHRFGHNRSEGFEDYVHYGRELGMEVLLARAYAYSKEASVTEVTVSSSAIRGLLQEGNVSEAAEYLGYDFFLDGTVVGGYQVGRKIGFPTANLRVSDSDKLIPCDGVYAVRVCVEGKEYGGMLSIGYRPTLENGPDRSIEVHIFRFDADIYQQPMRLSFVRRTRPELKFDSIEELIAQLHRDEVEIKSILAL